MPAESYTRPPWTTRRTRAGGEYIETADGSPDHGRRGAVATCHSTHDVGMVIPELPQLNADRICACVNALDGVKNPAALIAYLRTFNNDRLRKMLGGK